MDCLKKGKQTILIDYLGELKLKLTNKTLQLDYKIEIVDIVIVAVGLLF